MEADFARLEEKVSQLAQLVANLRAENTTLRQRSLLAQQENDRLKEKVEGAGIRLTAILAKIPEETA